MPNMLHKRIPNVLSIAQVLFIDGGQDTDCPAAVNAETVRLINEAGGRAEHMVDDAEGHGFSPLMREHYLEWFVAHKE